MCFCLFSSFPATRLKSILSYIGWPSFSGYPNIGDSSGLALLEILVRSCIGRATDDASIVDFFRITLFDSEDSLLKLRMPTASSSSEKLPRLLLMFYFIFCLSANLVLEW